MNLNLLLTISMFAILLIVVLILYIRSKRERVIGVQQERLTMDRLIDIVKYNMGEIVKDENMVGVDDEEFDALYNRKVKIQEADRKCVDGVLSAKIIVKDLMRNFIAQELKTEDDVLHVIDFKAPYLETRIKFEILLYFFEKKYDKDALVEIIRKYNLDRERLEIEDKSQTSYLITAEDVNEVYRQENIDLKYTDMLNILSTLIYQKLKGFGIIDTIRDMNIDGINCGTSGSVLGALIKGGENKPPASRSVWLYLDAKYIHLRFLDFGSEEELRRVIQLVARYNNPGPLTEKRGLVVNTMPDKSRVLALRPPAAEYWAVFIRKFTLKNPSTERLIIKNVIDNSSVDDETIRRRLLQGERVEGYTYRGDLVVKLLYYLMQAMITCGVTGRQGAGKTTLMASMIKFMDPKLTFRILEMAPELYARELYPERNILSVQETEYVSATALQDALKKSDAAVSLVGEVATDPIASRMIQMGKVASLFTIFSHHALTSRDLVTSLRDSDVAASGGTGDLRISENNVLDILKVDIHPEYTTSGKRYIERITEIIKLPEGVPYPDYDPKDPVNSMNRIQLEYYKRSTDRRTFITRDIIRYNLKTDTYETVNWFSPELTERMLRIIPESKQREFRSFVLDNWKGLKG